MAKLHATTACAGLLPLTIGTVTVAEVDAGVLTIVSPYGDPSGVEPIMAVAHGVAWPKPGRALTKGRLRLIWFGRNEVLLMGPEPDQKLHAVAAVVDQSDAWAVVHLEGAGSVDVLARLVPIDMRPHVFKNGHTARTQVGHMSASVTRLGDDAVMVLVFRSMAATLVHELKQAMAGVAARA